MSGLIEWIIFLLLSTVAVVTAAGMIITMSMYRAGLALMASFIALAGLFVLLDADLLAVIQVMMNVGGMLVMVLFMVMLMIDPGGEMMWDMKRKMRLPGPAAFSMAMPRRPPPEEQQEKQEQPTNASDWTCPMHPEVSAPGPGECPICGMDLVPRAGASGGDSASTQAQTYTCPMHPEIRQNGPGECPICGMDLVPATDQAQQPAATNQANGATTYTCPMHPEVQQNQPGECPICGMDLVPATDQPQQTSHDHANSAAIYTCPMHPQVRQNGPGECPICGMDLVPAADQAPAAQNGAMVDHAGINMSGDGGMSDHAGMNMGGDDGMAMSDHGSMNMTGSGMSPRAHYEMMVGMAMSTAQLPWALAIGAVSAALLTILVIGTPWPLAGIAPTQDATTMVGELLLSRYMMGFEGAAVLILAGIVGAVIFAKREAAPAQSEAAASATQATTIYTCPMHPEIRQNGPGECPICGMDLVPAADQTPQPQPVASQTNATIYTCPMHPEIRQNGPGECPICGMDLVPAADQAQPAATNQADGASTYTCPMHPQVRQNQPGECPICGMDLVPEAAPQRNQPAGHTMSSHNHKEATMNADQQQSQGTVYTCPMHPEVRENQPGRCPKCGMNLVAAQDEQTTSGTGGHTHREHTHGGHQ